MSSAASAKGPVLVGIGANLPSRFGGPLEACEAALAALEARGLPVVRRSRWYRSAPVPASDQPWFVNGVVEIGGATDPESVMAILHALEASFGRVRRKANEPRNIDLDLLCFGDVLRDFAPVLPHPRMHLRAFVLHPMRELAPHWRHPRLGVGLPELVAGLDPSQTISAIDLQNGP